MNDAHNTFWRDGQVIVTFYSTTPLISTDGVNNGVAILDKLDLPSQRDKLNKFLEEKNLDFNLSFYGEQGDGPESPSAQSLSVRDDGGFNPPPGVYMFGLTSPVPGLFGVVSTSIVTFFNLKRRSTDALLSTTGAGTEAAAQSGSDEDGNDHPPAKNGPVVQVINTFNEKKNLDTLNDPNDKWQVPISAASPVWLCGATNGDHITQGCPLTPPMPVDDPCAFWHFNLPDLSPAELRTLTGDGVTVFVLDALPDLDVISQATERAGDDNLLLFDVNRNATFNYDIWNKVWAQRPGDPGIPVTAVGKDVYGRHFVFKMPDHGLYIAGVVRDLAPHAKVECIRVLNQYCVGDIDLLLGALNYIQDRMVQGGDLYQKPVVINMSLVIPTKEEAQSLGMNTDTGGVTNDVETCLRQPIQSLVGLGAIIVASAGNEGDSRENPRGNRPNALYPAAFANPPDSIDGIMAVGAVDGNSKVTAYSCYPGPRGIATYGGEIPTVDPPKPPTSNPTVIVPDAPRGIYSAASYPPLSKTPPAEDYLPPNDHGWAYWVGTSFAAPIISAVTARIMEGQSKGILPRSNVRDAIINAAGSGRVSWVQLDPATTGVSSGTADGPMIRAVQECQVLDEEDVEVNVEVEVINLTVNEYNQ